MLLAGNITAAVNEFGTLHITEAAGQHRRDNGVQVNQLKDGTIRVEGIATVDGTKSLINGGTHRHFIAKSLVIELGSGRDTVLVGNNGPIQFTSVRIDAGADSESALSHDSLQITNLTTAQMNISTGAGDDVVKILDSKVTGLSLLVMMGRGSDTLDVQRVMAHTFGAFMDPIFSGTRADGFGVDSVQLQNLTVTNQLAITTDPTHNQDPKVPNTMGVSDYVTMSTVSAGDILVSTFGGFDTVTMYYISAKTSINVLLGNGNDALTILHAKANKIESEAGSGTDTVTYYDNTPVSPNITGFEISPLFPIFKVPVNRLDLGPKFVSL